VTNCFTLRSSFIVRVMRSFESSKSSQIFFFLFFRHIYIHEKKNKIDMNARIQNRNPKNPNKCFSSPPRDSTNLEESIKAP